MSAARVKAPATESRPKALLRDNGLTVALSALFIFSIAAMGLTGWKAHNTVLLGHGTAPVGLLSYLRSGDFASAVFENWESELQMAAYVILTAFLFQRGSAELRDSDGTEDAPSTPPPSSFASFLHAVFSGHRARRLLRRVFLSCTSGGATGRQRQRLRYCGRGRGSQGRGAALGDEPGSLWA